jgi:ornithine carbamoyltransferase
MTLKRDFLAITDLSRDTLLELLDLARRMKAGEYRARRWR